MLLEEKIHSYTVIAMYIAKAQVDYCCQDKGMWMKEETGVLYARLSCSDY